MVNTQIENDKTLIRRAHMDKTQTGRALLRSVTFEMAEQRLAAENWFWSEDLQDFAHVSEPGAEG